MTSFEEAFAVTETGPDERAAGVISGADPYRELELYLEKVNEEIGEVFDKWNNLSAASNSPTKVRHKQETDENTFAKKRFAERADKFVVKDNDLSFIKSCSLPSRRNSRSFETYLDAWSQSLLAEFNTIIKNGTSSDTVESAEDDYDEVAADSSDDDSMRMKYRLRQRDDFEVSSSSSPTVSPSTSEHSSGSSGTRRTPPYLSRIGRSKQRSHVASVNNKRDPMLVNVKIYPQERLKTPEMRKADYAFENHHRSYGPVKYCISQNYSRDRHAVTDMGTQTSPAESRSSSFTWISDCSDDDHSSTTSSTEDSRRLGDSSGDLTPVKDEPESGIGTASFPRHNKYNKSSNIQKHGRKEIWEKLRRRQKEKSGFTSRKSTVSHSDVDYQKDRCTVESSSDPDLAVFRIPRPTCLPLATSSLSPESSRETLPSPSATSLTLGSEPRDLMVREFAGKSSSAPLLLKHPFCNSTKKVSRHSRFHSEKLLIVINPGQLVLSTAGSNSADGASTDDGSFVQMFDQPVVGLKPILNLYHFKNTSRPSRSIFEFSMYSSEDATLEQSSLDDRTEITAVTKSPAKILRSIVAPKHQYFVKNEDEIKFQQATPREYFASGENVINHNQIENSLTGKDPFWGDLTHNENEINVDRESTSTVNLMKCPSCAPTDESTREPIVLPPILHNVIIPELRIFYESMKPSLVSMRPENGLGAVNKEYSMKNGSIITTASYSRSVIPADHTTTNIMEDTLSQSGQLTHLEEISNLTDDLKMKLTKLKNLNMSGNSTGDLNAEYSTSSKKSIHKEATSHGVGNSSVFVVPEKDASTIARRTESVQLQNFSTRKNFLAEPQSSKNLRRTMHMTENSSTPFVQSYLNTRTSSIVANFPAQYHRPRDLESSTQLMQSNYPKNLETIANSTKNIANTSNSFTISVEQSENSETLKNRTENSRIQYVKQEEDLDVLFDELKNKNSTTPSVKSMDEPIEFFLSSLQSLDQGATTSMTKVHSTKPSKKESFRKASRIKSIPSVVKVPSSSKKTSRPIRKPSIGSQLGSTARSYTRGQEVGENSQNESTMGPIKNRTSFQSLDQTSANEFETNSITNRISTSVPPSQHSEADFFENNFVLEETTSVASNVIDKNSSTVTSDVNDKNSKLKATIPPVQTEHVSDWHTNLGFSTALASIILLAASVFTYILFKVCEIEDIFLE